MPKERNKADGYREKAYEGDTKAISPPMSGSTPAVPRISLHKVLLIS